MSTYFISGIGTDVGKTIVSAVLVEMLQADYWKPVQTGAGPDSDTLTVKRLVSNTNSRFFPEAISLLAPLSPHEAAARESREILLSDLVKPFTSRALVIEGAGGLMVPLNSGLMMAELISHFQASLILVCSNYLGSINHTLLSLELVKQWKIPCTGIIFTGIRNTASEQVILGYSGIPCLGYLPFLDKIDQNSIKLAVQYITL